MSAFSFKVFDLNGPLLIKTRRFRDTRGYFMETYSSPVFAAAGINAVFVQDNQSLSEKRGVVRGLHFQHPPFAQAKLVRVLKGAICDVAVDIRRGSPSYGHWCAALLTAENAEQLFIPRGFAHGFCTLEARTEVIYKVDNPYSAQHDGGISWADPNLRIEWPIAPSEALISAKDAALPQLANIVSPFHIEDLF